MGRRGRRADRDIARLDISDVEVEQRLAPRITVGLVEDEQRFAIVIEGVDLGLRRRPMPHCRAPDDDPRCPPRDITRRRDDGAQPLVGEITAKGVEPRVEPPFRSLSANDGHRDPHLYEESRPWHRNPNQPAESAPFRGNTSWVWVTIAARLPSGP